MFIDVLIIAVLLLGGIASVCLMVVEFYKVGEPDDFAEIIFLGLLIVSAFFMWPAFLTCFLIGYVMKIIVKSIRGE